MRSISTFPRSFVSRGHGVIRCAVSAFATVAMEVDAMVFDLTLDICSIKPGFSFGFGRTLLSLRISITQLSLSLVRSDSSPSTALSAPSLWHLLPSSSRPDLSFTDPS